MRKTILTLVVLLLAPVFLIGVTAQTSPYDPWCDLDDDGDIDIYDIVDIAGRYGTTGIPISKTELLLELQAKVDALNATLASLQEQMDNVQGITHSETAIVGATGADYTTSTTFDDISGMSVDITVARNSTLVITFSAVARVMGVDPKFVMVRALVNSTQALPNSNDTALTAVMDVFMHSFTFHHPNIEPGTYTVKIQWKVYDFDQTGYVYDRTLTVIALPTTS